MKHSHLNKQKLLAWIEHCLEHGVPLPTDGLIADEYGFRTTELARTLLADLADAGQITIRSVPGCAREISLGKRPPTALAAARPLPTPAGKDPQVDRVVAKIARIVGQSKPRAAPAVAAAPPTPPPPPPPPPPPAAAPDPEHQPSPPVVSLPLPASSTPKPKAMTLPVPWPVFEALSEQAIALRVPTGRYALDLLVTAVTQPAQAAPAASPKPRLKAAVLRAAREDSRPFEEFVTALIDMGLESYLDFQGAGRAAA